MNINGIELDDDELDRNYRLNLLRVKLNNFFKKLKESIRNNKINKEKEKENSTSLTDNGSGIKKIS